MTNNEDDASLEFVIADLPLMSRALENLHAELREASEEFQQGKAGGRLGAIAALRATTEFLGGFEPFMREGLLTPFVVLTNALLALEENNVMPIVKPERRTGRAPASGLNPAVQALALHTVEKLCQFGLSRDDAIKMVTASFNKLKIRPGRGRYGVSGLTLKNWKIAAETDPDGALNRIFIQLSNHPSANDLNGMKTEVAVNHAVLNLEETLRNFRGAEIR